MNSETLVPGTPKNQPKKWIQITLVPGTTETSNGKAAALLKGQPQLMKPHFSLHLLLELQLTWKNQGN